MPTDPPVINDRPLTATDIHQFSSPHRLLASKIAPHLDGEWTVTGEDGSLRALLIGPDGEALSCNATDRRGYWEAVIRPQRPADFPDGYGQFHWNGVDAPLTDRPSEIAAQITADLLPTYRATLERLREPLADAAADTARLREKADVLAARLGPDWYVKEHPDRLSGDVPRSYFTVRRSVQNKQIFGTFTFEHRKQTVGVTLVNVNTDTLDIIAEAVIRRQQTDSYHWRRWPRRIGRALLLMTEAGYSITGIGPAHTQLFGPHLLKMDSHVGVGYSVVTYLRERPDTVEHVIRTLDPNGA